MIDLSLPCSVTMGFYIAWVSANCRDGPVRPSVRGVPREDEASFESCLHRAVGMLQRPQIDSYFPKVRPAPVPASIREPLCSVLIDAEEDFAWMRPVRGEPYDLTCMRHLSDLQTILAAYGAIPTYLLTYPVLQDEDIVDSLRAMVVRGQCLVGIQLHPWVTPPFTEAPEISNSFVTNLGPELEEAKLIELMRLFRTCFGEDPTVFRAGRYGLSRHTPSLLAKYGFAIDTSLAPCTSSADEQGPDFSTDDYRTFWFGDARPVLEVPLCRSIVGWGGETAARVYLRLSAAPPNRILPGLLARTRCAERITLSPEGNDASAVGRLALGLLRRGQRVLPLSLHSSSLSVGQNPYVQSRADLHAFYDQLSAILDMLANRFHVRFVPSLDLPALLSDG